MSKRKRKRIRQREHTETCRNECGVGHCICPPAPERPEPGAASTPERALAHFDAQTLRDLRLGRHDRVSPHDAQRLAEAIDLAESRALAAERDLSSLRAGVERLAEEEAERARDLARRAERPETDFESTARFMLAANLHRKNATALRALLGAGDEGGETR
jgi:hypothetical protein